MLTSTNSVTHTLRSIMKTPRSKDRKRSRAMSCCDQERVREVSATPSSHPSMLIVTLFFLSSAIRRLLAPAAPKQLMRMSREERAGQQGKLSASAIAPKSPIPFSRRSTRTIWRSFGRTSARARAPWFPIRLQLRSMIASERKEDSMGEKPISPASSTRLCRSPRCLTLELDDVRARPATRFTDPSARRILWLMSTVANFTQLDSRSPSSAPPLAPILFHRRSTIASSGHPHKLEERASAPRSEILLLARKRCCKEDRTCLPKDVAPRSPNPFIPRARCTSLSHQVSPEDKPSTP
mmetsp:Transcript_44183/g.139388  ORF Transcript_44183/g.139388 Transcript_44183/m.139388 type:complete len:295 (+) Transcript_44183:45-929(+)